MNELTRLIRNDCKPSLGVTEPGAIALAVAAAKKRTRGTVREIHLALNSGMYKNAFTCGIPGTREVGFLWAAALGAVAGKAEKELEALENIDEASVSAAKALLDAGAVTAEMTGIDSEIYIRADVKTELDVCSVTIRHTHTNIVSIVLNGEELLEPVHETRAEEAAAPEIHGFSFEALVSYAKTVPIEEISFLREAFSMNLALLEEGLRDARKNTFVLRHVVYGAASLRGRDRGAGSGRGRSGDEHHGLWLAWHHRSDAAVCRSEGGRVRRRSAFAGGSVEYARDAVHKRVLRKAFRDVRLRRRSGNGHGVRALYAARRQSFADFYDASQYGAFHHGHDL